MDYARKIRRISNSYYNLGLEYAGIRDLSGAVEMLKKSLRFNKYNTDARNLLGLIYYEIGEVADALVQWVISLNLDQNKNQAEKYLGRLQGRAGYLDAADQMIKKYNQALIHAQNGSDDLAILQLTRVVEQNRNYIKAHLLLSLLYIAHEEYTKAGKSLFQVLQVDKNNIKAQWYMSIVKDHTGKAEIEKRKLKNAFSHRQMQDDDIIIPPSYKENTGIQTVLNLIVGLLIGVLVISFLIIPANNRILGTKHNREMLAYSEALNQKNLEIDELNRSLEGAKSSQSQAENSLAVLVNDNGGVLSQYQRLARILDAYRSDDPAAAAQLYVELDRSALHDGVLDGIIDQIQADMETQGYQVLQGLGETAAAAGNTAKAITHYQQSLAIKADNPQVLYQLGMMYKRQEDSDTANEYFGEVIMDYPDSQYADLAKTERGY